MRKPSKDPSNVLILHTLRTPLRETGQAPSLQLGRARKPAPQHGGFYGVGHQHGDSQRADTAGDGRYGTGDFSYFGVDVANQG